MGSRILSEHTICNTQARYMACFEVSFLAYILSFVHRGDVYAVMQVCKKWLEATRMQVFWKRLIVERVQDSRVEHIMHLYDPYVFSEVETLREQMEWLFVTDGFGVSNTTPTGSVVLSRLSGASHRVLWHALPCASSSKTTSVELSGYSHFSSYGGWNLHGWVTTKYEKLRHDEYVSGETLMLYDRGFPDRSCSHVKLKCRKTDGTQWEGWGIMDDLIVPDGKGKWTFFDGTTFEGENVAVRGVPHGSGVNQDGESVVYFEGKRL